MSAKRISQREARRLRKRVAELEQDWARLPEARALLRQAAEELRYAVEHYPRSVALTHCALKAAGIIEYQLEHSMSDYLTFLDQKTHAAHLTYDDQR